MMFDVFIFQLSNFKVRILTKLLRNPLHLTQLTSLILIHLNPMTSIWVHLSLHVQAFCARPARSKRARVRSIAKSI